MAGSATTFIGNLTQDPEIRFLGDGGAAKLSFSIAVNHFWTDQSGEKQEKTSYFNCVAWRNLAEDAANVLEKGLRVIVTGRLEQRTFEDKDGNNRSVVELIADEIGVSTRNIASMERKSGATGAGRQPAQQQRKSSTQRPAGKSRPAEDDEPF